MCRCWGGLVWIWLFKLLRWVAADHVFVLVCTTNELILTFLLSQIAIRLRHVLLALDGLDCRYDGLASEVRRILLLLSWCANFLWSTFTKNSSWIDKARCILLRGCRPNQKQRVSSSRLANAAQIGWRWLLGSGAHLGQFASGDRPSTCWSLDLFVRQHIVGEAELAIMVLILVDNLTFGAAWVFIWIRDVVGEHLWSLLMVDIDLCTEYICYRRGFLSIAYHVVLEQWVRLLMVMTTECLLVFTSLRVWVVRHVTRVVAWLLDDSLVWASCVSH